MRIAVDHRTHYSFSDPQARIVEMLRLTPSDTRDQTVVSWGIDVNVDARMRTARDGFGNAITMLYADGPIEALEITVVGEVLTGESSGVVAGAPEPLPPALFRRVGRRTRVSADLAEFVHDAIGGAESAIDRLHRLNSALHAHFETVAPSRDQGFSASAAFRLEHVAPRDLAHMFIAAARGMGLPARFVSGYRSIADEPSSASHAWAEAHVDGLGWVAFDPSAGISADDHYVRVAIGLDAGGAAPIIGQRTGPGSEALDVDLHVGMLGG
jgi:transglutaminase-like putative cysteine protease